MSVEQGDVTFASFGKPFQERVLQAMLCDHSWAQQMVEVLRPSYFELEHLRWLFDVYQEHYSKHKCFPTFQVLIEIARDRLKEGNDAVLSDRVVEFIRRVKLEPSMNELPWTKERALDFCRNQALKEGLEQAVDLIQVQKYEAIVDVVKKAITVGTPSSTGHDFFEDIEARFYEEDRSVIATGMKQLDSKEIMNGGLGRGEIGVIIAPTGIGKSHFLVNIGANAIRNGKNVVHYTFELRDKKVGIRYDSNFCGISSTDVPNEREYVIGTYDKIRAGTKFGRLMIKEYPTNTASVVTLRSHIEKLSVTKDFKPDLIIVDYADIMRSTRQYDSLRHELKLVYEELRGLAMELGIPIWTASQSNRDSVNNEVVGLDNISESYGKAMVCDFIVTLSRKPLSKANGLGNLFVAKNRLGKDGIVYPVKVDTARSIIEILDKEVDLEEFQKTQDNDMKKLLKAKWNEVANDRLMELRKVDADKKPESSDGDEGMGNVG